MVWLWHNKMLFGMHVVVWRVLSCFFQKLSPWFDFVFSDSVSLFGNYSWQWLSQPPSLYCIQGRNEEGDKGDALPWALSHCRGPKSLRGAPDGSGRALKSLNNVTSTFFNTVHLLPKDLFWTRGCRTCFLPCVSSILVMPLTVAYPVI